jgi:hypothetical protein
MKNFRNGLLANSIICADETPSNTICPPNPFPALSSDLVSALLA